MARKEHKRPPKVIGHILYTDCAAVSLESPAWFDWLASHSTFYLESNIGTFTARREVRDGATFWYAFRRYHKKLYKVYLGRSADLSYERLLVVARQLAEKAGV